MAVKAETKIHTLGVGDTKENTKRFARGAAMGAARGAAAEIRRQRSLYKGPNQEPIKGFQPRQRMKHALAREVAFARDASLLAITRAALAGAAQGAVAPKANEAVGRTNKRPSQTPRS
ncbi:MAG: hypothetical protein ACM3IJ_01275 [Candidatus Levyibacteriota bacterium]